MMAADYCVTVYDCAGEYSSTSRTDFAHVLHVYAMMRRSYPDKVVQAFNIDRCDYDSDGLTEDERDAIAEVE